MEGLGKLRYTTLTQHVLTLLWRNCCVQESRLTDGAGHRPAYSLRTLCRALDYARRAAPAYGLTRSLWDGLSMSFLTQVRHSSGDRLVEQG